MTININPDDVKLFEENRFTKDQVGATVNHYREQGLSDDDIQAKMNEKLNQFKGETPTLPHIQLDEDGNNTVLQGGISYNDFVNSKDKISDDVKKLSTKRRIISFLN